MRKINSKEEIERKRKRNQIILGIILMGTMLISTAGYAFFNQDGQTGNVGQKVEFNGIEYTLNEDGFWHFKTQESEFYTTYNPQDIENISSDFMFDINNIYNKPLYYVGGNPYAHSEISQNIGRYVLRYQEICLKNNDKNLGNCESNLPIKSCDDNVIVFIEKNSTKIYNDKNCLFIESSYGDQLLISDRIIFKTLGIR